MKDIKILISSVLIISAFFLGYVFAKESETYKIKNPSNKIIINVENKGKNIQIDTQHPDVILLLNGQETSSGSIVIE